MDLSFLEKIQEKQMNEAFGKMQIQIFHLFVFGLKSWYDLKSLVEDS